MGCKQHRACLHNKSQNFKNQSNPQCKPADLTRGNISVCRQCCDKYSKCSVDFIKYNPYKGGPINDFNWQKVMTKHVVGSKPSTNQNYNKSHSQPATKPKPPRLPYGLNGGGAGTSSGYTVSEEREQSAVNRLQNSKYTGIQETGY